MKILLKMLLLMATVINQNISNEVGSSIINNKPYFILKPLKQIL